MVKKLTLKQLKLVVKSRTDCSKRQEYCQSKEALIDLINGLPDGDPLRREHKDYLINEIVEKQFHLPDRDEL